MSDYNLNIESYSFAEILDLFKIPTRDISEADIKSAKKKVLSMHPDKSRLSSEYFIFYKKAYAILVEFYSENNKMNIVVPSEPVKYNTDDSETNNHNNTNTRDTIRKIPPKDFNKLFNTLFNREMVAKEVPNKNDWFKSEEDNSDYTNLETTTAKNMASNFDRIRERTSGLVKYSGNVRDIQQFSGTHGANIHGDEDDEEYVCSNVFSKLKYDDLRKVHKNETIFSVGEKDFEKSSNRYKNTGDYDNGSKDFILMTKSDSEALIKSKDDVWRKTMLNKEFAMKSKIRGYEEKNKTVLAAFMQLTDK